MRLAVAAGLAVLGLSGAALAQPAPTDGPMTTGERETPGASAPVARPAPPPVTMPPAMPAAVPTPGPPAAPSAAPATAPPAAAIRPPASANPVLSVGPAPSVIDGAAPPKGAEWHALGADANALVLVDSSSIVRMGAEAHMWVTMVFAQPRTNGAGSYEMSQTRGIYDCRKNVWRIVTARLLDAKGEALFETTPEARQPDLPVQPGAGEARLLETACSPAVLVKSETLPSLAVARQAYVEVARERAAAGKPAVAAAAPAVRPVAKKKK